MERAPNSYYNLSLTKEQIAKNAHRGVVGGNWDKTREITMKYLKKVGLKKTHKLLDLGCGSFRNGIAIIDYLDHANYFGQDICPDLIKAGYEHELKPLGLDEKLPKKNLASNKSFAFSKFKVKFNLVLAVSLFSHLPKEIFVDALVKLKPKMAKNGKAHLSFFLVDEDQPKGKKAWPEIRINTYSDRDPFHYKWSEIEEICKEAGWGKVVLGSDPGYPRKQQFAVFSV